MESVTITPSSQTVFDGDTGEFSATITPANSTSKFLKWSSSDTDVATIDNYGRFATKKPGSVTITAETSDGKISGTATLTVAAIPVTGVTLNKTTLEIVEEDSETLIATVAPDNATVKDVEWKSSDESIATVDNDGKVTAIVPGNATITVTTKDGGKTATCAVSVKYRVPDKPETLDIWKNDEAGKRAILGGSVNVTSDFLTYDATEKTVAWTANTTGKPRTATLTTGDSKITVTQITPADFKGKYSFRTQRFSNNTTVTTTAADVTIEITFGDPLDGKTAIYDVVDKKSYTNNVGIVGLYLDAVLDGVFDIDYDEKTVRFGAFLDERNAQPVKNGNETYPYVCFIPEGGSVWSATAMTSPWLFVPVPISDEQNYQWLWFTVSEDFKTLNYNYPNKQFMVGKDGSNGSTIIGITCAICKNAKPAAADINGTYNVIYQANPGKAMNTGGFTITRK